MSIATLLLPILPLLISKPMGLFSPQCSLIHPSHTYCTGCVVCQTGINVLVEFTAPVF
jgi:hypothetical protein